MAVKKAELVGRTAYLNSASTTETNRRNRHCMELARGSSAAAHASHIPKNFNRLDVHTHVQICLTLSWLLVHSLRWGVHSHFYVCALHVSSRGKLRPLVERGRPSVYTYSRRSRRIVEVVISPPSRLANSSCAKNLYPRIVADPRNWVMECRL